MRGESNKSTPHSALGSMATRDGMHLNDSAAHGASGYDYYLPTAAPSSALPALPPSFAGKSSRLFRRLSRSAQREKERSTLYKPARPSAARRRPCSSFEAQAWIFVDGDRFFFYRL